MIIKSKKERITLLENLAKNYSNSALDIGIGTLKSTIHDQMYEKSSFDKIYVMDAFEDNINARKENKNKYPESKYNFIHSAIEDFNFDNNQNIDFISLIHVIEHIPLEKIPLVILKLIALKPKVIVIETPDQFEDGCSVVKEQDNIWQAHHCLVNEEVLGPIGFEKVLTYQQNELYSNSIYLWKEESQ